MNAEEKKIKYKGDLFELVSTIIYSKKSNSIRIFEKAHRPPGVRMLFRDGDKILMSREFRSELNEWDYRLPGGKVFDEFLSYSKYLNNESELLDKVRGAVVNESDQEVGLIVDKDKMNLLYKSVAGASVIWDLYYFEITDFKNAKDGQKLEEGEQIDKPIWMTFEEVKTMCLNGKINEDRTVAFLLRYILNQ
jgi:ADP-ribose pyrophosphatase